MIYTVTNTIQSQNIDDNQPVEVQWYEGQDMALAISAMTQAAVHHLTDVNRGMPARMRYHVLAVNLTIKED